MFWLRNKKISFQYTLISGGLYPQHVLVVKLQNEILITHSYLEAWCCFNIYTYIYIFKAILLWIFRFLQLFIASWITQI